MRVMGRKGGRSKDEGDSSNTRVQVEVPSESGDFVCRLILLAIVGLALYYAVSGL